jgi:hypothetical protein
MNWQQLARIGKQPSATMYTAARFLYHSATAETMAPCVEVLDREEKAYFHGLVPNPLDRRTVK